jgi:hypothetical protein
MCQTRRNLGRQGAQSGNEKVKQEFPGGIGLQHRGPHAPSSSRRCEQDGYASLRVARLGRIQRA